MAKKQYRRCVAVIMVHFEPGINLQGFTIPTTHINHVTVWSVACLMKTLIFDPGSAQLLNTTISTGSIEVLDRLQW